ncbi:MULTISPECIES: DMT family transporter [Pseudomonadota]|jgi:small multidrug resistance pump|uniref:Multidrug efflux SMR transporter n=4 Tax=Pseudomonas TaxID=286 RepID=A0A9X4HVP9_9PSED|nr:MULTISPECIES: multidrug efflux SMR transporter [Pseudomonadota]MDA8259654.1 multidrug efflux SMR transporter [Betaproteobacteria bacterium]TNY01596.1 multidrug efflux SMR transporter [Stenotrophomonas maltophilia]ABO21785.1 Putative multidrug exporter [Pseudomonas putida DOT-T1E]ETU73486.1 hypothetical protein Q094_06812 [Pseudomonas aeruginosa PS42]KSR89366.1 QacE family quaternary ammonium compound efflux SMR transporter [Pseudomonas aeruginosa]
MNSAWLLLGVAIICEISAAIALRFSDGFTKVFPTVLAIVAFGMAFYTVSVAMKTLPVSIAYPVWAGAGTAGVALLGVLALREPASISKGIGVALVVAGVVLLNIASGGAA